jgi:hypothetical protein
LRIFSGDSKDGGVQAATQTVRIGGPADTICRSSPMMRRAKDSALDFFAGGLVGLPAAAYSTSQRRLQVVRHRLVHRHFGTQAAGADSAAPTATPPPVVTARGCRIGPRQPGLAPRKARTSKSVTRPTRAQPSTSTSRLARQRLARSYGHGTRNECRGVRTPSLPEDRNHIWLGGGRDGNGAVAGSSARRPGPWVVAAVQTMVTTTLPLVPAPKWAIASMAWSRG